MQHRKTFRDCAFGLVGAIAATFLFAVISPSAPNMVIGGYNFGAIPIALLAFVGFWTVAMKLGGMFDADDPGAAFRGAMTPTFTLPVKTNLLVLGPLVIRALCVATLWLVYCLFGSIATHGGIPVVLPTLILVLTVSCFQASSWLIRTRPFKGMFFMFGGMLSPTVAAAAVWRNIPQSFVEIVWVGLILYAVISALQGAPLARHSDAALSQARPVEKMGAKDKVQIADLKLVPLTSALKAQIWFRLKNQLHKIAPIMAGVIMLIAVGLKTVMGPGVGFFGLSGTPDVVPFFTNISLPVFFAIAGFVVMVLMPLEQSGAVREGKLVMSSGFDPFVAIRPITTADLTFAKMYTAVIGGFWLTLVMIAGLLLWEITPGGPKFDLTGILTGASLPRHLLLLSFAAGCMPFLIASLQFLPATSSMFPERVKKVWKYLFPLVFGFSGAVLMLRFMPNPFHQDIGPEPSDVPVLIGIGILLVATKLAFVCIGAVQLHRTRLLQAPVTVRCLGIGAAVWIALTAVFYALLPSSSVTLGGLALLVALLLPANRILWHIVLLDKTRHM
jgi:hypothetical protein